MPRKPTNQEKETTQIQLSHSQLETWEQCPWRWYLQRIVKVPQAPAEALILGNALHAAIEADGRCIMTSGMAADLVAIADETMDDELAKADHDGLITEEQRANMRRRVHTMLAAYREHVQSKYHPLAIEETFSFDVDGLVRFTGRIDARTEHAIVDWKTSGKLWKAGDVDGKDQATAYLIAHPEMRQVTFIVFSCSAEDPDTCIVRSHIARRTAAQKIAYQAKVRVIANAILKAKKEDRFPIKPGPLCGWCGVLGSCSSGQAWLQVKGRHPAVPMVGECVRDMHAGVHWRDGKPPMEKNARERATLPALQGPGQGCLSDEYLWTWQDGQLSRLRRAM